MNKKRKDDLQFSDIEFFIVRILINWEKKYGNIKNYPAQHLYYSIVSTLIISTQDKEKKEYYLSLLSF